MFRGIYVTLQDIAGKMYVVKRGTGQTKSNYVTLGEFEIPEDFVK